MSSVTLVHTANAVERNEMPFGRDTRVIPSNIVLGAPVSPQEEEIWGSDPPVHSDAAYRQITLAIVYVIKQLPTFSPFVPVPHFLVVHF